MSALVIRPDVLDGRVKAPTALACYVFFTLFTLLLRCSSLLSVSISFPLSPSPFFPLFFLEPRRWCSSVTSPPLHTYEIRPSNVKINNGSGDWYEERERERGGGKMASSRESLIEFPWREVVRSSKHCLILQEKFNILHAFPVRPAALV